MPRNCALFIAQQVVANVRELEGALNKVVAISRFKGTAIDLDVVRESLKDVLAIRARTISVENIQRVVSEYFRIPLKELVGPKRTRIYARPRQLAMGLARELTGDSFPEIGMAFGGRDHSTVMHACEKSRASVLKIRSLMRIIKPAAPVAELINPILAKCLKLPHSTLLKIIFYLSSVVRGMNRAFENR